MGLGANYGLDKPCVIEGTTAVAQYTFASMGVANQSAKNATSAGDPNLLGVFQETCDAAKLVAANAGKVVLNVRMLGLSKVLTGGVFAKGDPLTNDTTGRAVKQTTAGARMIGIAQEASGAANAYVNILLTPGATI